MIQYSQMMLDSFPYSENGIKVCPSGDYTQIKIFPAWCEFADNCIFGDDSHFGEGCIFGNQIIFGIRCIFDTECTFGNKCTFGSNNIFNEWCCFGSHCAFGSRCSFGVKCKFGIKCYFDFECAFDYDCIFDYSCKFGIGCINKALEKQKEIQKKAKQAIKQISKPSEQRLFRAGDKVQLKSDFMTVPDNAKVRIVSCVPWRDNYNIIYVELEGEEKPFSCSELILIEKAKASE